MKSACASTSQRTILFCAIDFSPQAEKQNPDFRKTREDGAVADSKHASGWLSEFEAIAPGIVGVEAPDTSDGFVPNTANSRIFQKKEQRVDVIHSERGMGFCGGAKSSLDTDVKLGGASLNQQPPRDRRDSGFSISSS